jgi:pyridoxine 4-dehydrogenase
MSLRRLGLDRIDLFQLHRIDPQVPLDDQLAVLVELHKEGKICHIGLSQVTLEQLRAALALAAARRARTSTTSPIAPPRMSWTSARGSSSGSVPGSPSRPAQLAWSGGPLDAVAARTGATPLQLALAYCCGARR